MRQFNSTKGFTHQNFLKKISGGFTLIELLMVVAIIGILAAVVLAALSNARSRGADASVKSNLRSAITQGEVLYNTRTANKDTYVNACTSGIVDGANGVGLAVAAAAKSAGLASVTTNGTGTGTTATCNDNSVNGAAWAAEVPLNGSTLAVPKMWCVDSTGKIKQEAATFGAGTACA